MVMGAEERVMMMLVRSRMHKGCSLRKVEKEERLLRKWGLRPRPRLGFFLEIMICHATFQGWMKLAKSLVAQLAHLNDSKFPTKR